MIYNVDQLIRDIRVAIDENGQSGNLVSISDEETLLLDDIIRSKIEDAVRIVGLNAPVYLIGNGKPFGESVGWFTAPGRGAGYTLLPDDFLRLINFQMSDWAYPVSEAIDENNPIYKMQSSRYPGVRGCPQKPVVAIVPRAVGLTLEFYSSNAGEKAYVTRAMYLPMPKIQPDSTIEFDERLYRSVVYTAGSLTMMATGNNDMATILSNLSSELLV